MSKINLDKLDQYDQEKSVEKFHKKKTSSPNKKHVKKESKHKSEVKWEELTSDED